jgi:hypothetical protein
VPVTALSPFTLDFGFGQVEMDIEKPGIIRYAVKIYGIWKQKSPQHLAESNWLEPLLIVLKFVGAVYPQQMPIYYRCKSMTCPLQQQLLQQHPQLHLQQ